MITFAILSLILLVGFIVWASGIKGEIPSSYSALGTDVGEYFPSAAINPWSIITFAVAFLMLPPMVGAGDGNMWQCLGFFAPLYLIVVALTPDWEKDRKQLWIHRVGAGLCAAMALLWLIVVRGELGLALLVTMACMVAGTVTRSIERCTVFWLEASMFLSVYLSLII